MNYLYWLALGLVLGGALIAFSRSLGHSSEKKVLAIALIVAAGIYVIFALIAKDPMWSVIELTGIPIYGFFIWLSLKYSFYWLSMGWATHPLWDIFLHLTGPGQSIAPKWYAVGCISFDLLVAIYIAFRFSTFKTSWR
ncbi:MAG: hypothetical protein EP297_09760 [Gammaproteobacteria bacterium]|nr:MAG: hypothetical protein EP297_09760 [Gammaproteobacteria bacterium]